MLSTRACSSIMGSKSAETSGGSSGGRQPSPLDLYSKGTQIIELGSAVWPENPIRTGRSEVYIWGSEHAVKLCMGPTFALHEYTMSRAARNYAVRTVAMFTIHGKPNGIVMERGKSVNPVTCDLKQIAFEMVRAVQGLYSIGIIHGDIKLSSFLVCRDGCVRLCDFGTSEYKCDSVSHSEMSIPWSRPSLLRNPDRPRVKADDLYSLGLTIWELYTGKVPFVPPTSEGWESLDINEVAEEAILAGEQVDLNDILDLEIRCGCFTCERGGRAPTLPGVVTWGFRKVAKY
ncbi:uncharacterized protein [Physcomitrium patens]|uniref:Protein kinase domain-containing protein n=1 Tax=Physcomitrium patens TaxID=3218 RepID=A0A2K1J3A1_PHYPA|nr:putative 3-phosphoinositide-dependent protein kinase 2 [Physcomitrium patens]PNR36001.1 hypothetical protein PHYPA_021851 [Physcomitrium patens]|eukprot:XP_024400658.1 putative 3-phosphoinositide-dependent protein kinase 2 [Physcomitrella patens]